jgi:hypothetical protein
MMKMPDLLMKPHLARGPAAGLLQADIVATVSNEQTVSRQKLRI